MSFLSATANTVQLTARQKGKAGVGEDKQSGAAWKVGGEVEERYRLSGSGLKLPPPEPEA